jgi:cysteine desulfuration protein SufE
MSTRVLDETIHLFQETDVATRLELLLDYAGRLPPLPERLRTASARGWGRVPECQTPVSLFVEAKEERVRLFAAVVEEAPTVRGFVSILVEAYDGATAAELAAAPEDLIDQLGLSAMLRMMREMGLHAIIGRLKREGARLRSAVEGTDQSSSGETSPRRW